jgi:hypothetical protein
MDHQSATAGQSLAPSSQSRTVGRAYAEKAAKTIFARYPNPKAGPEYLVELTNCLAEHPQWIVDRLADRYLGITAKHKEFAPSIGSVIEAIGSYHEMKKRSAYYADAQSRRPGHSAPVRTPFRPFPRLWEAFAGEPEVIDALDHAETFDRLSDISRTFATRGKEAARKLILPELSTEEREPVDKRETSEAA